MHLARGDARLHGGAQVEVRDREHDFSHLVTECGEQCGHRQRRARRLERDGRHDTHVERRAGRVLEYCHEEQYIFEARVIRYNKLHTPTYIDNRLWGVVSSVRRAAHAFEQKNEDNNSQNRDGVCVQ